MKLKMFAHGKCNLPTCHLHEYFDVSLEYKLKCIEPGIFYVKKELNQLLEPTVYYIFASYKLFLFAPKIYILQPKVVFET